MLLAALAAGAVACGGTDDGGGSTPPPRPIERRLTDWPGTENNPRFSPDGRWLAFDAEVDGRTDLFRLSLADGEVRRLTDAPSSDRRPAWSPDGRRIAFQSNRDGRWAIWTVGADGGEARLVFPQDETLWAVAPDWSASGRLVATVVEPDATKVYGYATPWILPLDGEQARSLTRAGDEWFARWTAAGDELVYYKGRDDEIQSVDAGSGAIRSLSRGEFVGWRPVVSPDGLSLAFASNVGRWRPSLWVASLAAPSHLRRLTTGSDDDMPSWSPDGRWIVFSSDRASTAVVALKVASRARSVLVDRARDPQPLADGGIAYLADTPEGWRLSIAAPDGRPPRRIPTPPGGIGGFALSPDRRRVAYVASGERPLHSSDLYRIDLDDGSILRLTELGDVESPVWCEDGSLLFSSYGPDEGLFRQIWRLDPETGNPARLTRSRRDKVPLQCLSEPQRITARWTSDATGLYLLERQEEDWAERLLAEAAEGHRSPDGESLAYVATVDGRTDLFVLTASGEVERMTDDPLIESSPRWSADGRRLIFAVTAAQRDLWMIEVPPLPWSAEAPHAR